MNNNSNKIHDFHTFCDNIFTDGEIDDLINESMLEVKANLSNRLSNASNREFIDEIKSINKSIDERIYIDNLSTKSKEYLKDTYKLICMHYTYVSIANRDRRWDV